MDSDTETIPEYIILDGSGWWEQPPGRLPLPEALASYRFQCGFAPPACLPGSKQLMISVCIWRELRLRWSQGVRLR